LETQKNQNGLWISMTTEVKFNHHGQS